MAIQESGESGAFKFDRDTALERLDGNRFRASVSPDWNIGKISHGGYVACIGLAAMAASVPHPDPLVVSIHFPYRSVAGPADIEVGVLRTGAGLSSAVANLVQEEQARVHCAGTFGDLSRHQGPTLVTAERPILPSPDECVPAREANDPPMMRQVDLRITPSSAGFAMGKKTGEPAIDGWFRFSDGREPDAASLILAADSFPPPVLNVMDTGWVPTIQLTVHIRARPAPGWLQCAFRTRFLLQGYLEEDGEIWDSTGRLVALSRQLARV